MNTEMGRQKATYRASTIKIILNMIMALFALAFGILLTLMPDFMWIGLAIIVMGAIGVWIIVERQIMRSITIYENGIGIRNLRGTNLYHYEDLDDVVIGAVNPRRAGQGMVMRSYNFYLQDKLAFSIGSNYPNWQDIGGQILRDSIKHIIQKMNAKLEASETLIFPHLLLQGTISNQKIKLVVSQDGIQQNDDTLIAWDDVNRVDLKQSFVPGMVTIHTTNNAQVTFDYYNTRGSILAERLISARARRS